MKTFVASALSVFTLAVFLQVQVFATDTETAVEIAPTPDQPEMWSVWGQAELDGVTWQVKPVQCTDDTGNQVCIEVAMTNPTDEMVTASQTLSLMGNDSSPMSRMQAAPYQVEAHDVVLQADAGQMTSTVIAFALPETVPVQLSFLFGFDEAQPWSGQTVASFDGAFHMWGLQQADEQAMNFIEIE